MLCIISKFTEFHFFYFQADKSQAGYNLAVNEEMRTILIRRDSGDLKGKDAETAAAIQKIKRTYLNQREKEKMSEELKTIQKNIRSQLTKQGRMMVGAWRKNPEYLTQHLKLTCRYVMKKFPL